MKPARRKQTVPSRKSSYAKDADSEVLDDESVLAHLEALPYRDDDGDPLRGIGIAVLAGAATWAILIGIVVALF